MEARLQIYLTAFLLLFSFTVFGQSNRGSDYWLSFTDKSKQTCGYLNQNGDTIIQADNYRFCFTDTFRTYSIVLNKNSAFVAIDRQQNILYNVLPFDNGPDYASDGLFRIVKNNKIGYADETTGQIVIKAQFDCAFPFENGVAKVGMNCSTYAFDTEHHSWTTNKWLYIDKKGKKVKEPISRE